MNADLEPPLKLCAETHLKMFCLLSICYYYTVLFNSMMLTVLLLSQSFHNQRELPLVMDSFSLLTAYEYIVENYAQQQTIL